MIALLVAIGFLSSPPPPAAPPPTDSLCLLNPDGSVKECLPEQPLFPERDDHAPQK